MKNEVEMAGSKSKQKEIIISTIHPYACFLRGTKITSNNVIESKLINLNHLMIMTTREQPEYFPHTALDKHVDINRCIIVGEKSKCGDV